MAKALQNISRDDAVLNVIQWTARRGWSISRCAAELGVKPVTLQSWMSRAGYEHVVIGSAWLPKEK